MQTIHLGTQRYDLDVIERPRFESDGGLWLAEGRGQVTFRGNELLIDALPHTVHTVWRKRELSADVYVAFNALVLPPRGESNINFFLNARAVDGSDVLLRHRSGDYDEYHETCSMYIFTLTGFDPDGRRDAAGNLVTVGWSRVRKDPGFRLLSESMEAKSEVGRPYRVEVLKYGGRLLHAVNGIVFHDVTDPEPLTGGKFAFRTFNTRLLCSNVVVARPIRQPA